MTTRKVAVLAGLALLCAVVAGGFAARYVFSALFNGANIPNACLSEQWEEIPNVSGLRLEVEYKNCDTLAKDEAVSVYVLESREGAPDPNHRALVFRYDPGGVQSQRPKITASGNHRILISVPAVSSVIVQRRNWGDVAIDYNVGKNMNP
jgi:hypothetical protein